MSASCTGRLYPQDMFLVLIFTRGHGAVGRNMSLKNSVTPPGIDPGNVRLVVQRLNHYATSGSIYNILHVFTQQADLIIMD